jgi:hypothetical protein
MRATVSLSNAVLSESQTSPGLDLIVREAAACQLVGMDAARWSACTGAEQQKILEARRGMRVRALIYRAPAERCKPLGPWHACVASVQS